MNSGVRISGVRKGLALFALDFIIFGGVYSMLRLGSLGPKFSLSLSMRQVFVGLSHHL